MTLRSALEGAPANGWATLLTWRRPVIDQTAPIDLESAEKAAADLSVVVGQLAGSSGRSETSRSSWRAEVLSSTSRRQGW
jgi:hypothetical protein